MWAGSYSLNLGGRNPVQHRATMRGIIMNIYSVLWESEYGLESTNINARSEDDAVRKVTQTVDSECADCLVEVCEL